MIEETSKSNINKLRQNKDIAITKFYKFRKLLGSGGFGTIYYVEQLETKIPYAVKTISKIEADKESSFKTEIEISKKMNHPNILKMYETY